MHYAAVLHTLGGSNGARTARRKAAVIANQIRRKPGGMVKACIDPGSSGQHVIKKKPGIVDISTSNISMRKKPASVPVLHLLEVLDNAAFVICICVNCCDYSLLGLCISWQRIGS